MSGALAVRLGRFERYLAVIALLALAVRVAYVLLAKLGPDTCSTPLEDLDVCGDALYYSRQAEYLIHGRFFEDPALPGTPAADHPPLTALVLAPVSILPGPSVLAQRLAMTVIGTLAVILIAYLGRRVAGPRVGLAAAVLAALYPNLWVNDGVIMSESLAAVGAAAVLLTVYRFADRPGLGRAVAMGAACGVAVLARGEYLLFLPLVVLPVVGWARALSPGDRLRVGAAAVAVTLLLLAPWAAFNASRFHQPVLLATNDGLTLVGANCDRVYRGPATGLWSLQCAQKLDVAGDQSERSARYRDEAVAYVGDNLDRLPAVVAARVGRVWSVYEPGQMSWYNQGEGRERALSSVGLVTFFLLLPLAVAGAVLLRRRRRLVWPLVATALVVTLTAALFYGLVRFRIPAEVALVVLAAVSIDAAWSRWRPAPTEPSRAEDDHGHRDPSRDDGALVG